MRNIRKLQAEIRLIEKRFGCSNVNFPSDGSWIKIANYKLPHGKCAYNLHSITLLVLIPQEYDSASVSEVYIDKDLRLKKGMGWVKLPHTHDAKYSEQGYLWLCFHDPCSFVSLLEFLNVIHFYFTEPFEYQRV